VTVKLPPVVSKPLPIEEPRPYRLVVKSLGFTAGLFFMLFGICGLAGYVVYDHLAEPEFTLYTDEEGRFSIEFPTRKPSRIEPMAWTADGPVSFPAVMYERSIPNDAYIIAWIDLPPERLALGADFLLNEACSGASTYNPLVAKEMSRTMMTCDGHPACEMVCAVHGSQGKGIMRAVIVGKRCYLLFVGGGFIQADSERARHFLDSFKPF
jgi:hypothetical protein